MSKKKKLKLLNGDEFIRLANNFYNASNIQADYRRIVTDSELANYVTQNLKDVNTKYKVALIGICLNPHYWEFIKDMIESSKQLFLPGHDVDVLLWTDLPKVFDESHMKLLSERKEGYGDKFDEVVQRIHESINYVNQGNVTVFPIEPIEWPMPTLLRYSLFLQQEEKLQEYDYIFYCDVDMLFVGVVGDEILGEGLTAAQHPMFALDKKFWPPYEPNIDSTAYIKRPGQVIQEADGKKRFLPLYYAGGFQGGRTKEWIEAMKIMKRTIDTDFHKNYVAIWNDESHWNKYLSDNPPSVTLTPSYIYPDSLIKEYYEPIWGCSYVPKLITLTKKLSTTSEGAEAVKQTIDQFKNLPK